MRSGGFAARGQNQKETAWERIGYITLAVCLVPNKGIKSAEHHM